MRRHPYAIPKALRWAVFVRDGGCVLHFLEPGHVCKDIWNQEHAPNDFDRLTLEHVKDHSMMGKRAPSDERHMVALCAAANIGVPNRSQRDAFRAYLKQFCTWCQDYGDGMDPDPCPHHAPVEVKPRWLPGEWPALRDS